MTSFEASFSVGFDATSNQPLRNAAIQKIFERFPQAVLDGWVQLSLTVPGATPTEAEVFQFVSGILQPFGLAVDSTTSHTHYVYYDTTQRCIHGYTIQESGGAIWKAGPVGGEVLPILARLEWAMALKNPRPSAQPTGTQAEVPTRRFQQDGKRADVSEQPPA